jgi:hypothetical protein
MHVMQHHVINFVLDTTRCSTRRHTTHTLTNFQSLNPDELSITQPFCHGRPSGSECLAALDKLPPSAEASPCRSSLHLVPPAHPDRTPRDLGKGLATEILRLRPEHIHVGHVAWPGPVDTQITSPFSRPRNHDPEHPSRPVPGPYHPR